MSRLICATSSNDYLIIRSIASTNVYRGSLLLILNRRVSSPEAVSVRTPDTYPARAAAIQSTRHRACEAVAQQRANCLVALSFREAATSHFRLKLRARARSLRFRSGEGLVLLQN